MKHNPTSIFLGFIMGIVVMGVVSCTLIEPQPLAGNRSLLHSGTVERIIGGELQEQYKAVTSIRIIVDSDGEIVDADIHMIAHHREESLLLKGGTWQFFNHVPPTSTPPSSPLGPSSPLTSP